MGPRGATNFGARIHSASEQMDEDGFPSNPPQLLLPSGEQWSRPHKRSWQGTQASLQQAQDEYDSADQTAERMTTRKRRREAIALHKASTVRLCHRFSRGETCKAKDCKLRHQTDSAVERQNVQRNTAQRLAAQQAAPRPEKVVKYITDDPAANAALAAERAAQGGGHGAGIDPSTLHIRLGHKHWCEACSLGFDRRKQFEQHVGGKKHALAVAQGNTYWQLFKNSSWYCVNSSWYCVTSSWYCVASSRCCMSGSHAVIITSWSRGLRSLLSRALSLPIDCVTTRCSIDYVRCRFDAAVPASSVTSVWSLPAFLDGLPRHSRTRSRSVVPLSAGGAIHTRTNIYSHRPSAPLPSLLAAECRG